MGGRVVEGGSLENYCRATYPGFESQPIRFVLLRRCSLEQPPLSTTILSFSWAELSAVHVPLGCAVGRMRALRLK